MQLEMTAFPKEERAAQFFDQLVKGLVCTSVAYTGSLTEENKLSLSKETATSQFDFNEVIGNFIFLVLGFIIIRNSLTYKVKASKQNGLLGGINV